jgi:hypothetical protein
MVGCTINMGIIGGYSADGDAANNHVIISGKSVTSGGTIVTGNIIGGYSMNGSATGNEVIIVNGGVSGAGDNFTGSILRINTQPTSITTAQNFEEIIFGHQGNANIGMPATSSGQEIKINTNDNGIDFNGTITGTGGISKTGNNTLTLSVANMV